MDLDDIFATALGGKQYKIKFKELSDVVTETYPGAFMINEGNHYHIHFEDCT